MAFAEPCYNPGIFDRWNARLYCPRDLSPERIRKRVRLVVYGYNHVWMSSRLSAFLLRVDTRNIPKDHPMAVSSCFPWWCSSQSRSWRSYTTARSFFGFTVTLDWIRICSLITSPDRRLNVEQMKNHPFFFGVDWNTIRHIDAPFVPHLRSITDTSYFPTDELDQVPEDPTAGDNTGANKDLAFLGYVMWSSLRLLLILLSSYTFKRFQISSAAF